MTLKLKTLFFVTLFSHPLFAAQELPPCLTCDKEITESYDPEKNNQSHFDCEHTNQYCLDCIHTLFFEKVKKVCPICHANGRLLIEDQNIPTTNTLTIKCLAETNVSSKYCFGDEKNTAIFGWKETTPSSIFLNKEEEKEQPIPLALITRWATVASKNPDILKKHYITYRDKMADEADREFTTFSLNIEPMDRLLQKINIARVLCLFVEHSGSLEPLQEIFKTLREKT